MNCPYGDFHGTRGEVHRHLAETHRDRVIISQAGPQAERSYAIACPVCGAAYEHVISPRLRDPRYLDDFDGEIRLVAFDMLLYHMQAEHENASAA